MMRRWKFIIMRRRKCVDEEVRMDESSGEEFENGEEVEECGVDEDVDDYIAKLGAKAGSSGVKKGPPPPRPRGRDMDYRNILKRKMGVIDTPASVKQDISDQEQVEGVQRLVSLFFAKSPSGDLDSIVNDIIEEFSAFEPKYRAGMIGKLKLTLKKLIDSDEAKSKRRKK